MPYYRIDGYEIANRRMLVKADDAEEALAKAKKADFVNLEDAKGVNVWEKHWGVVDGPHDLAEQVSMTDNENCPTCGK